MKAHKALDLDEHSFGTQIIKFARSTTIKGIPKLLGSEVYFLRILWILCVLTGLTVATLQLYGILGKN